MHDRRSLIEKRIDRVLTERIKPAVHRTVAELDVTAWHVDGGQGEPVSPATAFAADYEPFAVGDRWGPAWGTTWFRLRGDVPSVAESAHLELVIDLGWADHSPGFQSEGLVYRPNGSVVKGLNPRNTWVPWRTTDGAVDLYVEAAANPLILEVHPFLPTTLGEKTTAGDEPLYRLARADVCVIDHEVWELVADIDVLNGLMLSLPESDGWRSELMYGLERGLDTLDLQDVAGTAAAVRAQLAPLLQRRADEGSHHVSAVGHAHIDSAWLWPTRETVRKVARTVSNVTNLMDEHDDLVFAMSSAQQYEWIEEHRPEVFAKLADQVKTGRLVPTGGMWVESDTNMVGGEAMARQFVMGQGYFREKFGITCEQVWLPDSFGYSAALPQIVKQAGCTHFLTQKISWNQQNVFPHHTFSWEGIDGTRVFTHFPPIDTYNSDLSGRELAHAASNFRDKGATNLSLAPFGWGDGGGGPTREMLQRARRTTDLQGSPKVTIETPAAFFERAEKAYPNPPVWVGELYLELHRGTYTSQAKTKQGNRRCEHLLREAELWATTAAVRDLAPYPSEALRRCWKTVLLQQFHDILPGSSIAWVHREAAEQYDAVAAELEALIDDRLALLTAAPDASAGEVMVNASPYSRSGTPALGAGPRHDVPPVRVTREDDSVVLDNDVVRVRLDARGLVTSVVDLETGRDTVPPGQVAGLLQLHPDFPNMWDAWDVDAFYRNTVADLVDLDALDVEERPDGSAAVVVRRTFAESTAVQTFILRPGARQLNGTVEVDWHEREKILKLSVPIDVHTDRAAFETQFGHLVRPTHQNTSWDEARFEVCAHRFVHVAERGFGVAVANSSTYGHDVTRHAGDDGATFSVVRLSLLRAPRFPDPATDQGQHTLHYSVAVAPDIADAVRAGYDVNLPERRLTGRAFEPVLRLTGQGEAAVEAVKLAEDGSGDVVVRLYEPYGARTSVEVEPDFEFAQVRQTNLLEDQIEPDGLTTDEGRISLQLRPFQIATLRFSRR
ncbi:alpha-mannosidase [Luteipulveratus mongoliensis]|uniref:Alpha-mannosidase n=1 Tax=Luteipulveratus mongoliensis TaxID=571913 RepID=A0A0K1JIC3_9MICO|nr:glycoside hydrolase family 38 C-terminal domain-containing protein [Luteipulveratus mongoliensis]AKU16469.1 alpha-mannosidase [Luteipulveratus mongoliensis]